MTQHFLLDLTAVHASARLVDFGTSRPVDWSPCTVCSIIHLDVDIIGNRCCCYSGATSRVSIYQGRFFTSPCAWTHGIFNRFDSCPCVALTSRFRASPQFQHPVRATIQHRSIRSRNHHSECLRLSNQTLNNPVNKHFHLPPDNVQDSDMPANGTLLNRMEINLEPQTT